MARPAPNKCLIDDCEAKEWCRGVCQRHYGRLSKNDPRLLPRRSGNPAGSGLTGAVADMPASYRQLDSWVRKGQIRLEHQPEGSGRRREMTAAERLAVRDVAARAAELKKMQADLSSGRYFEERLAAYMIAPF